MAHIYSKGWYVQELKKLGVTKHEQRKLESYKTYILANLYHLYVEKKNRSN